MYVIQGVANNTMSEDQDNGIIEIGEIKNLSRTVSDKLQEMIYTGRLKPGERLVQTELAERFRVSRVAIRDALQELRQSGLSIINPQNGGMTVRPVSEVDLQNIAFVRRAIEPQIAVAACKNIDSQGLSTLIEIIEKQERLRDDHNYLGFLKVDWEFHKTFYAYARNELALEIIEKLWIRASQARGMVLINQDWGAIWSGQSIDGHRNIVKAIVAQDEEGLSRIIIQNIRKAEKEQLQWFEQIS
jgi:DNA-binding GntR family transcriptional regulator